MSTPHKLALLPQNADPQSRGHFPSWLHRSLPKGEGLLFTGEVVSQKRLHTVCEEARCPNLFECWSRKTATFLAMGKECTRACGFCSIQFSKEPKALEEDEPLRIAESVSELGLKHVVITMVARDDLPDGGALHMKKIVEVIRRHNPHTTIELLTSDFAGNKTAWDTIIEAEPEIFNYNIETVRELTPRVRHKASYERTLELLHYISSHKKSTSLKVKSGLMVGLGETVEQVKVTITDLHAQGVAIVTIGQYLQPKQGKLLVKEFVTPEQFKSFADFGHAIGIPYMYCGPFIRSSYNADEIVKAVTHAE